MVPGSLLLRTVGVSGGAGGGPGARQRAFPMAIVTQYCQLGASGGGLFSLCWMQMPAWKCGQCLPVPSRGSWGWGGPPAFLSSGGSL